MSGAEAKALAAEAPAVSAGRQPGRLPTRSLVLVGLTLSGTIGAWGWLGLVLVATAAIGFCPLYPLLGMNTCPTKKA